MFFLFHRDPSSSDHLEAEHVQSGTHEPVNQPMPTRQTITTTASSPGGRSLSVPMTKVKSFSHKPLIFFFLTFFKTTSLSYF